VLLKVSHITLPQKAYKSKKIPHYKMGVKSTDLSRREFLGLGAAFGLSTVLQLYANPYPSGEDGLEQEYQKAFKKFKAKGKLDLNDFLPIAEKYPDSAQAHFLVGNVFLISTLPDGYIKAIKEYNLAIALNPRFVAAYLNRGNAYWRTQESKIEIGKYLPDAPKPELSKAAEIAIKDYNKALELEPSLFSAHLNKGVLLKMLQRPQEAVKSLDKAIETGYRIRPYSLTVADDDKTQFFGGAEPIFVMSCFFRKMIELAFSYVYKGQRAFELSNNQRFISNDNDALAFAFYHRAGAYAQDDSKYDKAIEDFSKAIDLNPDVEQFYSMRALVYALKGDKEKMFADLKAVKELAGRINTVILLR
jgi:tetratricopeptide (TPR) repeat protein